MEFGSVNGLVVFQNRGSCGQGGVVGDYIYGQMDGKDLKG